MSRLGSMTHDFGGTATTHDLTLGFAYNPASQIVEATRSNNLYAWTGHGSGTTSSSANGLNQLAAHGGVTATSDTKGNITVDGTYTYGYSSENLLTSLANSATGAVQPTIAFAYDPLMRLAVIDSSNSAFDVDFGYDGDEMVLEGLSSSRTRRYVHGPGGGEPLVGYLVTGTGTSRLWYQADERGSIARLSNDSGTPGGIGKFDEYGVGGTSRFRYTGQYWLGEANLLYYRARIYDARLGRFLQPDPIGYGDGMNMYAYVGGDPVNSTDPTGLCEANEHKVYDTGSRIGRCAANGSGDEGGLANGYSGFSTAGVGGRSGGHYQYVKLHGPASTGSDGSIVISAGRIWVPDVSGSTPLRYAPNLGMDSRPSAAPQCPPRAGYTCSNDDGTITYTKKAPVEPPKPKEEVFWDWVDCAAGIVVVVGAAATVETGVGIALTAAAGAQAVNLCRKASK